MKQIQASNGYPLPQDPQDPSISAGSPIGGEAAEPGRLSEGEQWALIANRLGGHIVNDVRSVIQLGPPAYSPGELDRGARAFFGWLVSASAASAWSPVVDAYAGSGGMTDRSKLSEASALIAINACFHEFGDELPAFGSFADTTAWIRQRCAAIVLQRLGLIKDGRYPKFLSALHKRHRGIGETPMLGSLPISAGIDTPPGVLREEQALDLVGRMALDEFRDHVALIDAATAIRATRPSLQDIGSAHACVHGALAQAWSLLPVPWGGIIRHASHFISDAAGMITDPGTWIAAGIPRGCVDRFSPDGGTMSRATAGRLTLACLGPSQTMVISGAVVVARGRGWNKSSIREIPAVPFTFAIQGRYGIAGGAFVTALKARAGHGVAMFLSDPRHADEAVVEELIDQWRTISSGPGAELLGDQMLLGVDPDDARGASVLEVLDSLVRVAKPLRIHNGPFGSMDRLFAFPLLNERSEEAVQRELSLKMSMTPALARGGADFRSIRASYVFVENRRGRSLTATMAASGQVTPTVTVRNYLNRREVGVDLRKALRFFQSICEALITNGGAVVIGIGSEGPDLDRLRRLARASGMAAAFGVDVPQAAIAPVLRFAPSEANLRDLFLALWALRVAARKLDPATWRARCLELFAAARAIASALRDAGLATDYAAAARAAYADHRSGRVSLPRVEGA